MVVVGVGIRALGGQGAVAWWLVGMLVVGGTVGGAALLSPTSFGLANPDPLPHPRVIGAGSGEGLAVSPSSWTLVAGQSVAFHAYLLPADNGCLPLGFVITWQLPVPGSLLGYLNRTTGADSNFTSFGFGTGTAIVNASALGLEFCPDGIRTFTGSVVATVHVVAPLQVSGPNPDRNPAVAGSTEVLGASVSGGLAPYYVVFTYGDGASGTLSPAADGNVTVDHRYAAGTFLPSVSVRDALGQQAFAEDSGPLLVAGALGVEIHAPTHSPEAGRAYTLSAGIVNAVGPVTVRWNDSRGDVGSDENWTVNFSGSGPAWVQVEVTDGYGDRANASALLEVQALLNLSLRVVGGTADLGEPIDFGIHISGGCGPYSVAGGVLPSGSRFLFQAASEGAWTEAVLPAGAGASWISAQVTDALGATTSVLVPSGVVVDAPTLAGNSTPARPESGDTLEVAGIISGGVPPFNWSVRSTAALTAETPTSGSSPSGLLEWSGTLDVPGPEIVEVAIRDATGATSQYNRSFFVAPALSVSLSSPSGAPEVGRPVQLIGYVQNGIGPYNLSLASSEGELRFASSDVPGPASWEISPETPGTESLQLVVRDASGRMAAAELNLTVAAAGSPSSGVPVPPSGASGGRAGPADSELTALLGGLGAGAGIGLVLLAGWVVLRRRAPAAPAPRAGPSASALALVRSLLQREETLDQEALLLLAEEEGSDPDAILPALERWVGLGRVRRTRDGEGVEQFEWIAPKVPDPTADPLPASEDGT